MIKIALSKRGDRARIQRLRFRALEAIFASLPRPSRRSGREKAGQIKTFRDVIFAMGRNAVSIRDVAQRSGVSIATVSNVLNERCKVSDGLRARVLQAVDELNYVANPIARSMRSSKTFIVGVIVVDLNCIFFAPLLKGIQNVMSKAGYNVIIYDSNYSSAMEKKYISMMKNNFVDGLIISGLSYEENIAFIEDTYRRDRDHDFPIVSLENNLSDFGIDSVFINNEEAALTATSHLIELGCRRILCIEAPKSTGAHKLRGQGYRKALARAGIPCDPALELEGDFSAISGYNAVQKALHTGISFDGIFASNDQMAVGAVRALNNFGISVPKDVKIVGFDNTFISSIVSPGLTTINVPIYEMGVAAAKQLLERFQNPYGKAVPIRMDYELIIRRSTMSSAQTNWDMVYW